LVKGASTAKAFVHANDSFINAERTVITKLGAQNKLPIMYVDREYVVAGGLMSYGPGHKQGDIGAAKYVDAILRGSKPTELAVAIPTEFVFSVNRSALGQIGLLLPADINARVTDWIE
jgi:putative ABC transport system substrate-binding protein